MVTLNPAQEMIRLDSLHGRNPVMCRQMACLIVIALLCWGCATSVGPYGAPQSAAPTMESVSFPPNRGPKRKIQVVQINIPADDIKRYPELGEKRVGFGLSNILVETLFDTGRFTFLADKEQILRRLVELWEMSEDGILVKNPVAPDTALQAPDLLIYAEVFDFVACSPVDSIGLVSKTLTCVTSVAVQVRIANTASGEYIPGSTDPLSPEGKYVHTVNVSLFGDTRLAFDQSAVGKATLKATQYAVLKGLQRFDRAGW
jgi:curli biogenesis system outer membrane secretion channel CsgG